MATIDSLKLPPPADKCRQTVAWFEAWKSDPLTKNWGEAQCQFFLDTALVHAAVWGMGRFDLFHELMQREREMGVVFEPMKAKPPKTEKAAVLKLVMDDRKKKAGEA
ncbi:MAG: hypothetical protein ACI364_06455 [Coriobacteriales bacterium]